MRDDPAMSSTRPGNFFSRRWNAQLPLSVLLWRDMLGVGTLVNVFASFIAMVLIAQDVHAGYALAVHLAPMPYNLFLFSALQRYPQRDGLSSGIGAAWFVAMLII